VHHQADRPHSGNPPHRSESLPPEKSRLSLNPAAVSGLMRPAQMARVNRAGEAATARGSQYRAE
jgi:hypothetical protein